MSDYLITMAKQAGKDDSLMASLIEEYSHYKNISWEQVAGQLWIDKHRMAKLALCRRPRESQFKADQAKIAEYVDMDDNNLAQFFNLLNHERNKSIKGEIIRKRSRQIRRNAWAFAFASFIILALSAFIFLKPEYSSATIVVEEGNASITKISRILYIIPRTQQLELPQGESVLIKAGESIRTGPNSIVNIHLYDGTTINLGEKSEFFISHLVTTDDHYQVRIQQLSGKALYHIKHLLGISDYFEINTPSTTVSVRGTVFTVNVIDRFTTEVACEEGVVLVSWGDQEIELTAGESITTIIEEPLPEKTTLPRPQIQPSATTQPTVEPTIQIQTETAPLPEDDSEELDQDNRDEDTPEDEDPPEDEEPHDNRDKEKNPWKNK